MSIRYEIRAYDGEVVIFKKDDSDLSEIEARMGIIKNEVEKYIKQNEQQTESSGIGESF